MNIIGAGSCILLSEAPLYKPHLWLVLTDPDSQSRVVAVMLRTATKFTDTTVTLNVGDHSFVKHESSVHYSTAQYFSVPALLAAMKSGRCHLRDTMTPALLRRLRQGLLSSPFTVNAVKTACETVFNKA